MWYRLFRLIVIVVLLVVAFFLAPRWWQEHARERQLAELSHQLAAEGPPGVEASLAGQRLRLGGKVAVSSQRERAVRLASRLFPPDAIDDEIAVAPPVSPFRFAAELEDGRLLLQGFAPDSAAHEALLDWIRDHGFKLAQDRLKLAEGAPVDWAQSVRIALEALHEAGNGDVELAWRRALLRGKGTPPRARVRARKLLERLQGRGFETSFQLVPVLSCLDRIQALAIASPLRFEAGEAVISADSHRFLDDLAEVVRACPETHFAVHGYTDNRGDPAANLALSQQRAEAVVQALVERGVPKDQFRAIGHGSASPIADNSTERGRARNRRIEFTAE